MKIYTTPPELMEDRRLDPYYYDPLFIEHEKVILSSFPQRESVGDIFHVLDGTHDSVDTRECADNEFAITFLRSQDIGDCLLRPNAGAYLRQSDHVGKCKRSKIFHGDVLLNIMASTGQSCLYFPSYPSEANANRAVGILRSRDVSFSEDEKVFLSVLLSSHAGGLELARNLKGSIQQRLNLSDISEVRFPRVGPLVCRYISDKVRQAERLRASAFQDRDQLVKHFASLLPIAANITQSKTARILKLDVEPRLNAEYYGEKYTSVERSVMQYGRRYTRLGDLCKVVRSKARPNTDCTYFEIGHIDTSTGEFLEGTRHTCRTVPNNAQRVFESGEIAVSTRRPNRGAIAIVRETNPSNFYSVFLARLKPNDALSSNWIREFLRCPAGRLLLEQRCTWTTYPVISEDDLATVPIPNDEENWEMVDRLCTIAHRCESTARILVDAAKILIEALIQRNVTEDELIRAQIRLEQGDDSADRSILSRLYKGGWDETETRPMFPDLETYYEILRMVEREQTEVATK